MRIEDYRRLSFFKNIDVDSVSPVEDVPYKRFNGSLESILNEIFSVDPVSGLPKGDIAYYLSSDGNPDIKNWLQSNLLAPRVSSGQSTPEGVTDDLIAEMSRINGESIDSWQNRLTSLRDSATAEIEKLKQPQNE